MGYSVGGALEPTREELASKNYDAGYYYNKGKQDAKREAQVVKRQITAPVSTTSANDEYIKLEARMKFLLEHSSTPEELALAKEVLGIK